MFGWCSSPSGFPSRCGTNFDSVSPCVKSQKEEPSPAAVSRLSQLYAPSQGSEKNASMSSSSWSVRCRPRKAVHGAVADPRWPVRVSAISKTWAKPLNIMHSSGLPQAIPFTVVKVWPNLESFCRRIDWSSKTSNFVVNEPWELQVDGSHPSRIHNSVVDIEIEVSKVQRSSGQ